jgi:hypothetical protein
MARHTDTPKDTINPEVISVPREEQKELLGKLGKMSPKAINVIFEALVAQTLCPMCWGRKTEEKAPLKVDDLGRCVNCKDAHYVADFEKNKWAANEILGRKLPMPKAIEMKVDDGVDRAELARAFLSMPKEDVMALHRTFNHALENVQKKAILVQVVEEAGDGDPGAGG